MKSNGWGKKIGEERSTTLMVTTLLLLVGGGTGLLLFNRVIKVLLLDILQKMTSSSPTFWGLLIGSLIIAILFFFRQDQFVTIIVIAVSIVFDWYLHIGYVALLMALFMLLILYLARSSRYPWVQPRALWLWILFLILVFLAGTRSGSLSNYEIFYYYNDITFGAFVMFWIGTVIARDVASMRRFLEMLTGFGTLIAIHAIIQATTGTFLFWSSVNDSYYASLSNFILIPGLETQRVGSFLLNPDWAGPFFAFLLFIALSFFVTSPSLPGKILYLLEVFLMAVALLLTYTYGAFIGAAVGIIFLIVFIGHMRYRLLLSVSLCLLVGTIVFFFSYQLYLAQLRPQDSLIRIGAWQTALRIIAAFPLTGIGLGLNNYLVRADPYRVPAQYIPLSHPLNSYLEFAANGGIPVLLVFVALLALALWWTLRVWTRVDIQTRALLGGCIAAIISLSVDSLTSNVWTVPPLAMLGWLVLGVTSSPLLLKSLESEMKQEKSNTVVKQSLEERTLYV